MVGTKPSFVVIEVADKTASRTNESGERRICESVGNVWKLQWIGFFTKQQ